MLFRSCRVRGVAQASALVALLFEGNWQLTGQPIISVECPTLSLTLMEIGLDA